LRQIEPFLSARCKLESNIKPNKKHQVFLAAGLNRFPYQTLLNDDVRLIVDSHEQQHHSLRIIRLFFKDAGEIFQRAVMDRDPVAPAKFLAHSDEALLIHLRLNEFNDLLVNRSGAVAEADDAMHTSGETDFPQHVAGLELGEDIPGKQGFHLVRQLACVCVVTTLAPLGIENLYIPGSQVTVGAVFLSGLGMYDIPLRRIIQHLHTPKEDLSFQLNCLGE
jgi:hypothetical protein